MQIRGRTCLAAITACTFLLLFSADSHSNSNTEAGRKYSIAQERLADLKKSPKKRKYRSYWMDVVRLFETIEKRYPSSQAASDACFDRAGVYADLYQYTKLTRDIDEAARSYGRCQASYPKHARAPEALYRVVAIQKDQKKDSAAAQEGYNKLAAAYPGSEWIERARGKLGIRTAAAPAKAGKNGKKKKKEPELRKPLETVVAVPKGPPGTVTNVRYWSGGNYTRIVVDQDKPIKFRAQELKNPDRLVFDILNSRVSDSVNKEPLTVNDGILKQVRTGQNEANTVRIVLDLASLKSYAAFPLHEPERLVIDVTGNAGGDDAEQDDERSSDSGEKQQTPAVAPKSDEASGEREIGPPLVPKEPLAEKHAGKKGGKDNRALSQQMGLRIARIAIDAGHGGKDPGAIGKGGLKEKHITLDIARRLQALVKERLGCEVIMTRDRDTFIELVDRPAIAKTKGADLFVSIHVNANRKRKARGIETYIQSLRASDRDAMATAAFENSTSMKTLNQLGDELDRIVKDLKMDDKQEESIQLAYAVQSSLVDVVKPVRGYKVNLGVKKAFFYVLVKTDIPSILAEVGFISNPDEEKLLKTEAHRQKIAEALFQGIKKYIESRGQQVAGL